ncbi:WSC-domain-containing protein [Auricularia subglabra TFB-10046 SS5]|nr:WSC-domain-containing protein [Auricularia subglabra TFB-10046 SS5]
MARQAHLWFFLLIAGALPSNAFFRMNCNQPVTLERADPIVTPGQVSTHLHQVLGGHGFDFDQDFEKARASSCSTCQAVADNSNYWTPTLWYQGRNGTFRRVNQLGGGTIYYLQRTSGPNEKLHAFPPGFRVLAGSGVIRSFNPDSLEQRAVTHHCLDYAGTGAEGEWNHLPKHNCPNGVRTQIFFPSCWDGKNLDSPNHKSHVAYPDGVDSGTCPKTHPVRLISLFFEVIWDTNAFKNEWWSPPGSGGQPFVLSNGDPTGYAFHGDFLSGWDTAVLQKAIDECTNDSGNISDCPVLKLRSDEDMSNCIMPPRVPDLIDGWVNRLPGCNPVQPGPGRAKVYPNCDATKKMLSKSEATFLTKVDGWTPLGCARDDMSKRAMPHNWTPGRMTVDKCVAHCSKSGYKYAGLEWARECWCSNDFDSSRIGQYACNVPCEGNGSQMCGGSQRLAVYKKGSVAPPKPATSPKPAAPAPVKKLQPTTADHSFPNPMGGWYPVGCFKDAVTPRALRGASVLTQTNMTPKTCVSHCQEQGFQYAGTEFGKECYCGNELYDSAKLSNGQCNMKCAGDGKSKCGGSGSLTVYRKSSKAPSDASRPTAPDPASKSPNAKWDALGCFSDSITPRALSGTTMKVDTHLTPQACLSHCSSLGFTYAGVEYGKECHCDNQLHASKKRPAGECNMKCAGDGKSKCGGSGRVQLYRRKASTKRHDHHRRRLH